MAICKYYQLIDSNDKGLVTSCPSGLWGVEYFARLQSLYDIGLKYVECARSNTRMTVCLATGASVIARTV